MRTLQLLKIIVASTPFETIPRMLYYAMAVQFIIFSCSVLFDRARAINYVLDSGLNIAHMKGTFAINTNALFHEYDFVHKKYVSIDIHNPVFIHEVFN